jgi:hypothetical protein
VDKRRQSERIGRDELIPDAVCIASKIIPQQYLITGFANLLILCNISHHKGG